MEVINNADMSKYTSFRAGGCAKKLITVENVDELAEVLKEIEKNGEKHLLIGNGSNILFKDEGYSGTVIKLGGSFDEITRKEGNIIACGASALLSKAARFALDESLSGFEFAAGIPGSVGGAMFMNAGAYGGEMKDIVKSVNVMSKDGKSIYTLHNEDMDFGYRRSRLGESGEIVLSVCYELCEGNPEEIEGTMSELMKKRNDKQPVNYPSAGSFFKRPEGDFAGRLVEAAGLRGLTVGGAQVSEKHCGFVINKGGATATDITDLMHLVQNTVKDKFGVMLEPEVRIIGD